MVLNNYLFNRKITKIPVALCKGCTIVRTKLLFFLYYCCPT